MNIALEIVEKKKEINIFKQGQCRIVPRNNKSKSIGDRLDKHNNWYEYVYVVGWHCRRWVALARYGN